MGQYCDVPVFTSADITISASVEFAWPSRFTSPNTPDWLTATWPSVTASSGSRLAKVTAAAISEYSRFSPLVPPARALKVICSTTVLPVAPLALIPLKTSWPLAAPPVLTAPVKPPSGPV